MGQYREIFLSQNIPDKEFERFVYALEHVRQKYPSMTLGAFATFLAVARRSGPDGITPSDLVRKLGQPLPTIFRQCSQLADGLPGKPGMKLLRKQDMSDGRSKKLSVSLTGMGLLSAIADILSAELPYYGEADDRRQGI